MLPVRCISHWTRRPIVDGSILVALSHMLPKKSPRRTYNYPRSRLGDAGGLRARQNNSEVSLNWVQDWLSTQIQSASSQIDHVSPFCVAMVLDHDYHSDYGQFAMKRIGFALTASPAPNSATLQNCSAVPEARRHPPIYFWDNCMFGVAIFRQHMTECDED